MLHGLLGWNETSIASGGSTHRICEAAGAPEQRSGAAERAAGVPHSSDEHAHRGASFALQLGGQCSPPARTPAAWLGSPISGPFRQQRGRAAAGLALHPSLQTPSHAALLLHSVACQVQGVSLHATVCQPAVSGPAPARTHTTRARAPKPPVKPGQTRRRAACRLTQRRRRPPAGTTAATNRISLDPN